MNVITMPVGMLGANCYLLCSDQNNCAVIDPGAEPQRIAEKIESEGLTPKMILLTHAHFDHIGGASWLKDRYGIPVWLHKADWELALDPNKNLSSMLGSRQFVLQPDRALVGGEQVPLDELMIGVIETPGHTPGGVSLLVNGVLFSGDTLFDGGYGRTDFWGGDWNALAASLKKLLELPGEYRVLPGHGGQTTIADQR